MNKPNHRLLAENERLREALQAIRAYTARTPHTTFGEACGVDACMVCLIHGTADAALNQKEHING